MLPKFTYLDLLAFIYRTLHMKPFPANVRGVCTLSFLCLISSTNGLNYEWISVMKKKRNVGMQDGKSNSIIHISVWFNPDCMSCELIFLSGHIWRSRDRRFCLKTGGWSSDVRLSEGLSKCGHEQHSQVYLYSLVRQTLHCIDNAVACNYQFNETRHVDHTWYNTSKWKLLLLDIFMND